MSPQVSDRFPDLDSLVAAKLLLPHEAERLQRVDFRTPHEATWTPILWALKLVCKARWKKYYYCKAYLLNFDFTKNFRSKGEVTLEPPIYANFVSTFEYIESCNRTILNYGWVEFPLAYTQVYLHF